MQSNQSDRQRQPEHKTFIGIDMNIRHGHSISLFLSVLMFGSSAATAQASLSACTSEKTHQMELARNIKSASSSRNDPYAHRSYDRFDRAGAQDEIKNIDEWLWKNCRDYSNEMRSIEQQYM